MRQDSKPTDGIFQDIARSLGIKPLTRLQRAALATGPVITISLTAALLFAVAVACYGFLRVVVG